MTRFLPRAVLGLVALGLVAACDGIPEEDRPLAGAAAGAIVGYTLGQNATQRRDLAIAGALAGTAAGAMSTRR